MTTTNKIRLGTFQFTFWEQLAAILPIMRLLDRKNFFSGNLR